MVYDAVTRHSSGVLSMAVFRENMARRDSPADGKQSADEGTVNEIIFPAVLPTIQQTTHLLVEEAMRRTGGNQTQAARMLGISQQALSKRLKAK